MFSFKRDAQLAPGMHEAGLHRAHRNVESDRHLGDAHFMKMEQRDRGALVRRQMLDRRAHTLGVDRRVSRIIKTGSAAIDASILRPCCARATILAHRRVTMRYAQAGKASFAASGSPSSRHAWASSLAFQRRASNSSAFESSALADATR